MHNLKNICEFLKGVFLDTTITILDLTCSSPLSFDRTEYIDNPRQQRRLSRSTTLPSLSITAKIKKPNKSKTPAKIKKPSKSKTPAKIKIKSNKKRVRKIEMTNSANNTKKKQKNRKTQSLTYSPK
jgi:hypothetical protein